MRTSRGSKTHRAFTWVEVLVVLIVLVGFAALLLPALAKAGKNRKGIHCLSNLKQVGLALRTWATYNDNRIPWQIPAEANGTMGLAESPDAFVHFLAITNELPSPKVLACNDDRNIQKQASWSQFNNAHLSYFIGLEANEANPQLILSGDRNLSTNSKPVSGLLRVRTDSHLGFTREIHKHGGNLGLADGSAQQVTDNGLRKQVQSALLSTNLAALRFSIPKPK